MEEREGFPRVSIKGGQEGFPTGFPLRGERRVSLLGFPIENPRETHM